ncbi:phage portal protein [Nesterenkonia rhizosphaerae]|uniref:Phage portal protein n=1 Tax=Nesterenkonia rhizosphaerae TaxID=1348272 RepID=A0ABP9G0M1_9MICC
MGTEIAPLQAPSITSELGIVRGVDQDISSRFFKLAKQLQAKAPRNLLRGRYYDSKATIQHLGIAVPPHLQRFQTAVGWPAKAVDMLERRIRFQGFVAPEQGSNPFELDDVLRENQFEMLVSMAVVGMLTHSNSWLFTTQGIAGTGDPEVVITARSALHSTGTWDARRRGIKDALDVLTVDENGEADTALMYTREAVYGFARRGGIWYGRRRPHSLNRLPAAMLPYRPSLDRPFGRSKINRPIMGITDRAVRTALRSEITAEFFSAPQRYMLDLDPGTLDDGVPGWAALIGRILAMERDPDDPDARTPKVGQFNASNQTPHIEHMRELAAEMAGEANIPTGVLGVFHDNPASDRAMHTAYMPLDEDAERAHTAIGWALEQVAINTVMIRDRLSEPSRELMRLRSRFQDPSRPTRAMATDSVVKQVQEGILPADSEVTLQELGYDAPTIRQIQDDRRRTRVTSMLQGGLRSAAESTTRGTDVGEVMERRGADTAGLPID